MFSTGPACLNIDDGEPARPEANDGMAVSRIDPYVVGVVAQRKGGDHRPGLRVEYPHVSGSAFSDDKPPSLRPEAKTLRLLQAGDAVRELAGCDVEDVDAAIAQFGDREALACGIERQVIDAARNVRQRDRAFEDKRLLAAVGMGATGKPERRAERKDEGEAAHPA
ncbi:MAG: hypothetical protein GC155_10600 [Alphaproteobacteria bacterium]|nr:hypothetical protein [Alphaproteobacteria bacterium]